MPSILIINPNSTESMTKALGPLVNSLGSNQTNFVYFTAPSGPKSINNENDAATSTKHCFPHLLPLLDQHDAFLVACYSPHPLVAALKSQPAIIKQRKPVTGIFEASISASLQLLAPKQQFGIVSTENARDKILADAVVEYLGNKASSKFFGVESTGLNAMDLHNAPDVRRRMMEASRRLVWKGNVGVICLGCAGMVDINDVVREACMEELGEDEGAAIRIVDAVQAGVAFLEGIVKAGC